MIPPEHNLRPMFRINRLIRLTKVAKQINVHNNVVRVSQIIWFFMIGAHIVGCIWWSIGVSDFNNEYATSLPPGSSWVVREKLRGLLECNGTDGTEFPCSDQQSALGINYMSTFYWALTTLIKTPYVHPDTVVEITYASIAVVLGAVTFAAILGNITAMINSFDKGNAQLREVINTLERLINKYDVPKSLHQRVIQYVQTHWSTSKGIDNQRILAKLPPPLRGDILEQINSDLVQFSPLFQTASHECVRVLLSKLRSDVVLSKENLLTKGQLCIDLFILVRGAMHVNKPSDTEGDGKKRSKSLGKKDKHFRAIEKTGAIVGIRDPFEKEFRYPFLVTAVKQVQVAMVSAKDLHEVFAMDNRSDIESICETLKKEFITIAKALGVEDEAGGAASLATGYQLHQEKKAAAARARSSSIASIDSNEGATLHERVKQIEDVVRMCNAEVREIRQDLKLLPQLCELLNVTPDEIKLPDLVDD